MADLSNTWDLRGDRYSSIRRLVLLGSAAILLGLVLWVAGAQAAVCAFGAECSGNNRDNVIRGEGENDLSGRKGDDRLTSAGASTVTGGPGDDSLRAFEGGNILRGNSGEDVINAANDRLDNVYCGGARDKVIYDGGIDTLENCERKFPR